MDIKGSYLLPCDRQRVWNALNDPELLKSCLKGCESLDKTADDRFEGTVRAKVGPVNARFNGTMVQTDIQEPVSCTMAFEGQGGVAGFAKGFADVSLEEEAGGTRLSYVADAQIGGKMAQMGARLVEGTARSMADDFFGELARALGGAAAPSSGGSPEADIGSRDGDEIQAPARNSRSPMIIIVAAIALAIAAWVWLT